MDYINNPKLYVNMSVINDTDVSIPVEFAQDYNIPLIENIKDWTCSIARFSVPNYGNSIMTFEDGRYWLSLVYQFYTHSLPIVYIPTSRNYADRPIYNISDWCEMLNETLKLIWDEFDAAGHTLPYARENSPYFEYNPVTSLITLYALFTAFGQVPDELIPVRMYCNRSLSILLMNFPLNSYGLSNDGILNYMFVIRNTGHNVTDGIVAVTQQANSFDVFSDFAGLVFTTSLPVVQEFRGSYEGADAAARRSASDKINMLMDFIPSDMTLDTFRSNIVYQSTQYRWVDISGSSPLTFIRVKVYAQNQKGVLIPVTVPPGEAANLKLIFVKKC